MIACSSVSFRILHLLIYLGVLVYKIATKYMLNLQDQGAHSGLTGFKI